MPLRRDRIRGDCRPRQSGNLPLHRLPGAHGIGLSSNGASLQGGISLAKRAPEDLREDGSKRSEACTRVLSELRVAGLLCGNIRSTDVLAEGRLSSAAGRVVAGEATVVSVCTALGDEFVGHPA